MREGRRQRDAVSETNGADNVCVCFVPSELLHRALRGRRRRLSGKRIIILLLERVNLLNPTGMR